MDSDYYREATTYWSGHFEARLTVFMDYVLRIAVPFVKSISNCIKLPRVVSLTLNRAPVNNGNPHIRHLRLPKKAT